MCDGGTDVVVVKLTADGDDVDEGELKIDGDPLLLTEDVGVDLILDTVGNVDALRGGEDDFDVVEMVVEGRDDEDFVLEVDNNFIVV